ncbi:MAG: Heimdall-CTERM domain-containing surface protein [Candidatus Hodarchaeota archaeon]
MPGFSFLPILLTILPLLGYKRKKKSP